MNDSNSETIEYSTGVQALAEEPYAKPLVSNVKFVVDSVEDTAYGKEIRHEAAQVDKAGKYEPKLTENGIPVDVLAKLLPGDDVVELLEPAVGGGIAYRFVKRAFDVVSCGCALIILAIPMGIIALKIKSESSGPVIYAQRRVGKGGKIFNVYKFRSMYTDAEARGAQWAQGDDPRVTPFGKVMRKTRMDEIPQFWNVFKGDMSVVGPRPALPNEVATYNDYQRQRLLVKPGMTCYWQTRRNRDSITFDEWVDLDLWGARPVRRYAGACMLCCRQPAG